MFRRVLSPALAFALVLIGVPLGGASAVAISPDIVISQVYGGGGNTGSFYKNDFIELYNRGTGTVSVDGWSVQYASASGTTWQVTALAGTIPAGRHYLVQQAAGTTTGGGSTPLPTPDASGAIAMSGTTGKVALVTNATALNAVCTALACATATGVRDFVGYGAANAFEGTGPTPALTSSTAALRAANGAIDTDNNSTDFTTGAPTPRNCGADCAPPPPPPPPPSGCDVAATHEIAQVQGSGDSTPIIGQSVRVDGIVTGDFQNTNQLSGFFIQDPTPDLDDRTSDGIFVFYRTVDVKVGDRVLVNGRAGEFGGQTQVSSVTAVDICGSGTIAARTYGLPRPAGTTFEPVEGVLLTFPEPLAVTEHFQLGRFGEVTVSSEGRTFQPTDRVPPGAAAQTMLAENQRRRLLIDDASRAENPSTVPFTSPHAVRIGDTATGITGVLSHGETFGVGQYRLQPTAPITFARTNPRPAAPAAVGGDISIASFNTLNYFTTIDGPTNDARGADSQAEFERQQAKVVAAITGIDAHILGLMEIENNGSTAVANLVDALNAATAPGTYAYITEPVLNAPNAFGGTFGTDPIKVAFIYRPAAVTPVGAAQTSADPVFDRPPLIQTWALTRGSEPFTLAVNHFKSKSTPCGTGTDADSGDGQGCWNGRRVAQATALAAALDALGVPSPLIVGDLNAYSEEDPIHVLEDAGYVSLSHEFIADADRYSYVFDDYSGELDHGLVGSELFDNVTGATIWHINADELVLLDYNTEFNPPGLYRPDAYRSSDHDALIIGLDLAESGAVVVNKTGHAGAPLAGAGFTLYTDNAPLGTFDGADTATTFTCTTDGAGTCGMSDVPVADYWLVETITPSGYATGAPTPVSVWWGETETVTVANTPVPGTVVITLTTRGWAPTAGVTFTLYTDALPQGGARGTEDTSAAGSCTTTTTTKRSGGCSITSVPLGRYWVVETVPAGIGAVDPVAVEVGLGTAPNSGDLDHVSFANRPQENDDVNDRD